MSSRPLSRRGSATVAHEPEADRLCGGLDAGLHAELLEDVRDVNARGFGLMYGAAPISRFVLPSASRARTCRSRSVSGGCIPGCSATVC